MPLTSGRPIITLFGARQRVFPVAAGVVCWEGGLVGLSSSGAGATAAPGGSTAPQTIVGVATATADNRTGAAGALSVTVALGIFALDNDPAAPLTPGDIGAPVYALDDHTVSKSSNSAARPQAGTLFKIDETSSAAMVQIR